MDYNYIVYIFSLGKFMLPLILLVDSFQSMCLKLFLNPQLFLSVLKRYM